MQSSLEKKIKNERLETVIQLAKGKSSKKNYILHIFSIGVLIFLGSLFSQIFFPEKFSILINRISDQGSYSLNPSGYYFFNTVAFISGIMLIPYFLYLKIVLKNLYPVITVMMTIFGILGSFGFSFVGIFPKDLKLPHRISAGIAFVGFFISANLAFIAILEKKKRKKSKIGSLILFYIIFNISFITMFVTLYLEIKFPDWSGSFKIFFNFAIWEWIYLFSIIAWLGSMFIFADDSKVEFNNNSLENIKMKILNKDYANFFSRVNFLK